MENVLKGVLLSSILVFGLSACGGSGSGSDSGTQDPVQVQNSSPVSNAGTDQNIATGFVVTLNGAASSDADGDTPSYQWSLTSVPSGSAAALSNATGASPTLTADTDGSYIAQLVGNDGTENSAPEAVTIVASTGNSAPVANAGTDQNIATGSVVTLNGAASSDADGDTLSYQWSLTSVPSGSAAALSNATGASPTFTADIDGSYIAQLTVNDGTGNISPDTVTIVASTSNSVPVANAGADQNIATGSVVTLNGAASSDADGDILSYQWSLISVPSGSAATLNNITGASLTFTADIDGSYIAQLTVNDGTENSAPDTVTIVASTANSAPVANAGTDQNVISSTIVNLDGSSSSDADGDGLSYAWSFISKPAGSTATFDNAQVVNPSFTADIEGSYVISLVVNDGLESSASDTVQVEVIQPRVKLYREISDSFSEVSLPYSNKRTVIVQATKMGISAHSFDTFKLQAQGQDFTITNLSATDANSKVLPFFTAISDSYEIPDGVEVEFELISPITGGATASINFTFEIQETGKTLSASYDFRSY